MTTQTVTPQSTTSPTTVPPTAPAGTVLDLLERARGGLLMACHSSTAAERYTQAHLSALRAGAALLAARSAPSRRARPRSVWEVLPTVAPELTEWAVFFAESGRRRLALERGADVVTPRDADDLVRQALADHARGRALSIPSVRYKAIAGAARLVPTPVLQRFQSLGRK